MKKLIQKTNVVKSYPELSRVNEKVITEAHNESLKLIDAIVKEANEFYSTGAGKEVN